MNKGYHVLAIVALTYVSSLAGSSVAFFHEIDFKMYKDLAYLIAAMTFFGVIGNIFLVMALESIDLSLFGPINSFKPVVSLIFAVLFLKEYPTLLGIAGIVIILAGSVLLSRDGSVRGAGQYLKMIKSKGVLLRIVSLVFISAEAVCMKGIVSHTGSANAFFIWALAGTPCIFCALIAAKKAKSVIPKKSHTVSFFLVGILFAVLQYVSFVLFEHAQVGSILALFQLSSVLTVFAGRFIFQERYFVSRLAGSVIMAAGAFAIIMGGL